MTTWAGWVGDFIAAASLPDTSGNRRFLRDWASHANSPRCANNPIDLSRRERGATNCGPPTGNGDRIKAYASHATARAAFAAQIASSDYPNIHTALGNGDPYNGAYHLGVTGDLIAWGSTKFAAVYEAEVNPLPPPGIKAAHAHGGWANLQRSFNSDLPASLRTARRGLSAGRHALKRAGKVRL